MTKTVRFDDDLEQKLKQASEKTGESASEFIRNAVAERCDRLEDQSLLDLWGNAVGSVASGKKSETTRTGEAFKELLNQRYEEGRV